MFKSKRIPVVVVAGVLCALAFAAPANAANFKAACVIGGDAKVTDKENPTIGIRLQGGKGNWRFSSLVILCVGIAKGTPEAIEVDLDTRGVYDNVVCGTGKVWGTVTQVWSGDLKYAELLTGQKFSIHFLATAGVFFWHELRKPAVPDLKDALDPLTKSGDFPQSKVKWDKEWQPAGVVQVTSADQFGDKPARLPPAEDECTKAFAVFGVVYVDL